MSADILLTWQVAGVTVEVVQGDITDLAVDAIINAANDHLWMGSGVAGAIKRRGGVSIEREAVSKGPVPVGSAIATEAGELRAKHVIHAAVMGQDLRTDLSTVAATTRSVLDLAETMSLGSVAMPLLGTGVGGLDLGRVATTMAREVAVVASEGRCTGMRVLLVAYDEDAAMKVRRAVEDLR